MTYVIGAECVDELAGDCVDACPVDCIYEGGRKRYIQPDECIQCGACLPVCPVKAISSTAEQDPEWAEDSRLFFYEPLTGLDVPLGSPGGAEDVGSVGTDTERVRSLPEQPPTSQGAP